MHIQPYLFFNGNCEEAFKFYEKALGGKINELHRYKDMPPQEGGDDNGCGPMTPEQKAKFDESIMHVNLTVDGQMMLMGSDSPQDEGTVRGLSISIGIDDVEKGRKVFEALSEGGEVKMPFQETFWAKGFGMCTDKFGVPWMVNAGDKPSP
ncbi:VOC family protein [Luteibacter jiangsuensis]|uniref:VOC family protein n=1 Tax=Luteibacter jiangsuensis TaxID=637577 RepID=A0ABX0Q582_9GAMM|nr:VOC family protein [Luteibacter jiangsuensis]NID04797.1 VOC family protein [Luteibacter jiangsuensis]